MTDLFQLLQQLSVRPRHPQADEEAQEAFKKTSPRQLGHKSPTALKAKDDVIAVGARGRGRGCVRPSHPVNSAAASAAARPRMPTSLPAAAACIPKRALPTRKVGARYRVLRT
jgi:hypothetical protein